MVTPLVTYRDRRADRRRELADAGAPNLASTPGLRCVFVAGGAATATGWTRNARVQVLRRPYRARGSVGRQRCLADKPLASIAGISLAAVALPW